MTQICNLVLLSWTRWKIWTCTRSSSCEGFRLGRARRPLQRLSVNLWLLKYVLAHSRFLIIFLPGSSQPVLGSVNCVPLFVTGNGVTRGGVGRLATGFRLIELSASVEPSASARSDHQMSCIDCCMNRCTSSARGRSSLLILNIHRINLSIWTTKRPPRSDNIPALFAEDIKALICFSIDCLIFG